MDADLQLAIKLDRELNSKPSSSNSSKPSPKKKKPRTEKENSIVNPEWEITDPNPDIHMLFQVFDKKYFWGRLDCVEVKWSPRMYSCAGICTYKGKWGGCVISLSLPLLKLRPRKDLIETLLHEMIHAFLFVADKNRDRGEHGPKFHEHMFRINKEAGTKITVYHTFHDEVKHYKQHWWRCNGPCQEWKPFFGLVKRSMNRAPGPNDFWFADHQAKCGGEFIKIKEPENFKSRKRGPSKEIESSKGKVKGTPTPLNQFFPDLSKNNKPPPVKKSPKVKNAPSTKKSPSTDSSKKNKIDNFFSKPTSGIKTLQNNNTSANVETYKKISNVHGFTNLSKPSQKPSSGNQPSSYKGTSGVKSNMGGTLLLNPKPSTSQFSTKNEDSKKEGCSNEIKSDQDSSLTFSGAGHILGTSGVSFSEARKKFLERFGGNSSPSASKRKIDDIQNDRIKQVKTEKAVYQNELEAIDLTDFDDEMDSATGSDSAHCPVCNKEMHVEAMNEHLDSCATLDSVFESSNYIDNSDDAEPEEVATSSDNHVSCPVCGFECSQYVINEHLDSCLG